MTLEEHIRMLRSKMLIHSYLYYWEDITIVDDHKWQSWADLLTELQKGCKIINFYDKEFSDWDGSTGCHLPRDDWVQNKALQIRRIHESYTGH